MVARWTCLLLRAKVKAQSKVAFCLFMQPSPALPVCVCTHRKRVSGERAELFVSFLLFLTQSSKSNITSSRGAWATFFEGMSWAVENVSYPSVCAMLTTFYFQFGAPAGHLRPKIRTKFVPNRRSPPPCLSFPLRIHSTAVTVSSLIQPFNRHIIRLQSVLFRQATSNRRIFEPAHIVPPFLFSNLRALQWDSPSTAPRRRRPQVSPRIWKAAAAANASIWTTQRTPRKR